jgi:hypothetical protein
MTLHDDDPEHFEFFLKFMYTHHYDKDAIVKLAAGDSTRRVTIPCEIFLVADKYDMPLLFELIAKDVEELLAGKVPCTLDLLQTLISAYYESVTNVGSPLGKIFVSKIKNRFYDFPDSDEFVSLVKAYPVFGADMALSQTRGLRSLTCLSCRHPSIVTYKGLSVDLLGRPLCWYCEKCGNKSALPPK